MSDVQTRIAEIRSQGFYVQGEQANTRDAQGQAQERRVNPKLFDEVARDLGQAFAAPRGRPTSVSSSQLRGFYGEVKALEIKLQEMSSQDHTGEVGESGIAEPVYRRNEYLVRMIAPKVAYIQGKRTGGNVSREFRDFIETSLNQVHSAHDFMVFMRLFESVVGFFYGYGGGRN